MDIITIHEFLDRPIAFHRIFAKIGGSVNAGIFLSQAFYWSSRTKDPNGWFYKTQAEWEEETCLTRREQETARRNLRDAGILEEALAGIPARLFFRINVSAAHAKMIAHAKLNSLSMAESAKLDCTNPPSSDAQIRQTTICTESTSESTFPELKNSGSDRENLVLIPEPVLSPVILHQPKRRGRPPKPADPRHQVVIEMWNNMWNERFNTPYSFHSKDFKHLKEFLRANPSVAVSKMRDALSEIWSLEVQKGAFAPNSIRILNLCDLCLRWNTIIGNIQ